MEAATPDRAVVDQLTKIPGIGSQTAARLHKAGIHTVEALASTTVERIVVACDRPAITPAKAQSWIEHAAEATNPVGPSALDRSAPARPPRLTFTIEVRTDGHPTQVLTTRVGHLENDDADAWSGWSRSRLLDFLEARIGLVMPSTRSNVSSGADTEPDPAEPVPTDVPEPPSKDKAVVDGSSLSSDLHRFGLLTATSPVMRRGEFEARLRLDAPNLGLAVGANATAHIQLVARPLLGGRSEVVKTCEIDLSHGGIVETVLSAQLPHGESPFAVSAIIRVMLTQQKSLPQIGLGGSTLDILRQQITVTP